MRKLNLYLSIVVINLLLYLVLTFGLVNYEDAFDGSKGEFYSLSSMEITEIICFLSLILWYVINSILLCMVVFKLWRKKKHTPIAIKSSNEVKFIGMWVLKMLSKLKQILKNAQSLINKLIREKKLYSISFLACIIRRMLIQTGTCLQLVFEIGNL